MNTLAGEFYDVLRHTGHLLVNNEGSVRQLFILVCIVISCFLSPIFAIINSFYYHYST